MVAVIEIKSKTFTEVTAACYGQNAKSITDSLYAEYYSLNTRIREPFLRHHNYSSYLRSFG